MLRESGRKTNDLFSGVGVNVRTLGTLGRVHIIAWVKDGASDP